MATKLIKCKVAAFMMSLAKNAYTLMFKLFRD
jgi:hypothetical protein